MATPRKTIALLNNEGTLTQPLCLLLKEIFIKYDLDKDGMLNRKELNNYFSSVGDGQPMDDSGLDLTMMCMGGSTEGFSLKDFYTFYEFQSKYNPYEVIDDLLKLFSQETIIEKLSC